MADETSFERELALERAIRRWARERLGAVARKVRYQLRRMPAGGIYGHDEHRTLWHEYRHEVEEGPTPALEWAWDETLEPMIGHALEGLTPAEAVLCSIAVRDDPFEDVAPEALHEVVSTDDLRRAVRAELHYLADGAS